MSLSKRDIAYNYLRKKIIFGDLRPGDVLDEKKIVEDLGFSRTPVREAINKLVEEDLILVFPRKGFIISSISLHDLHDMLDTRLLVEPYLIQKSFPQLEKDTLKQFRARVEKDIANEGKGPASVEDDFDFTLHSYFAQKSGNRFLQDLMNSLLSLSQRTRVFLPSEAERIAESNREHLAIIDSCLEGDVEKAMDSVRVHLENSRRGYMQMQRSNSSLLRD
ncbi:MAG: GntR family transcriptional regulator [Bifidobacteriaceae bacterium]|jgi:DNA-binding GntR family transcriptional regulator|nr:GntR family transcriptional regulator [Bifidobacteriaceae bacterium]MCI1979689.1 GntR family transcriptional regulator [Bifidobacteriaceae bacterium]